VSAGTVANTAVGTYRIYTGFPILPKWAPEKDDVILKLNGLKWKGKENWQIDGVD